MREKERERLKWSWQYKKIKKRRNGNLMILSTLLYDLKIVFCVFFVAGMFLPLKYFVYFDDVVHSTQQFFETLKLENCSSKSSMRNLEKKVLRKAFGPLEIHLSS